MKKFLGIVLLISIFCVNEVYAQLASSMNTGKDKDGNFVIPAALAVECKVSVEESGASGKMEDCFKRLIKERSANGEGGDNSKGAVRVREIWRRAINETDLASLVDALKKKVYAADYEKDVMEEFQDNMGGGGGISGEAGGIKATETREDSLNTAQSDKHIAKFANEQLNNLMATIIMRRALRALNTMDETYLKQ